MRKTVAVIALALVSTCLASCTSKTAVLPLTTRQPADSVGGGPPAHAIASPVPMDSVGGGPPA